MDRRPADVIRMHKAVSKNSTQSSFREFRKAEEMFTVLANDVASRLAAGVARNGRASLVASGGTTPGAVFDRLAHSDAPWSKIEVTLTDDRWIETTSDRSNEKMVRMRLLMANAAAANFIPFKTMQAHARDAERDVDAAVAAIHRPFDVVMLGMGTDGHIASLIPDATGLARAMDRNDPALVRTVDPPDLAALGERITLTLRALLDARWIVLLIRGEAKRATYERALAGNDVLELPVRAVLHQTDTPLSIYWSP